MACFAAVGKRTSMSSLAQPGALLLNSVKTTFYVAHQVLIQRISRRSPFVPQAFNQKGEDLHAQIKRMLHIYPLITGLLQ